MAERNRPETIRERADGKTAEARHWLWADHGRLRLAVRWPPDADITVEMAALGLARGTSKVPKPPGRSRRRRRKASRLTGRLGGCWLRWRIWRPHGGRRRPDWGAVLADLARAGVVHGGGVPPAPLTEATLRKLWRPGSGWGWGWPTLRPSPLRRRGQPRRKGDAG